VRPPSGDLAMAIAPERADVGASTVT
jgi:hypothetical protein